MSTILWILLAVIYIVCVVTLAMATFRKGHYWLFWLGFLIFPFLWIVGALMGPTPAAEAKASGAS